MPIWGSILSSRFLASRFRWVSPYWRIKNEFDSFPRCDCFADQTHHSGHSAEPASSQVSTLRSNLPVEKMIGEYYGTKWARAPEALVQETETLSCPALQQDH